MSRQITEAFMSVFLKAVCLLGREQWGVIRHHLSPPQIRSLLTNCIHTNSMNVFLLSGLSLKKTSWFQLNYLIEQGMNKTWGAENEWVKGFSFRVVSNPCEFNFSFVLLPFTAHIPQPDPIWNTKVWPPSSTLTHSHQHTFAQANLRITLFHRVL